MTVKCAAEREPGDTDEARWEQAAAFIEVYGEAWPDEAMASIKAVPAKDHASRDRWIDLVDKLTMIAQTPRY